MNVEAVFEWIQKNAELIGVAIVPLVGGLITFWRMRVAWTNRQFLSRVNFSINYVEDNFLKIRTLRESDLDRIIVNNRHGKRVVLRALKRTTLTKPFLEFPERDRWVILNAILNELSEQFARGFVAVSMGVPVATATYVFGLSCERDPRVQMNKIRVMVIEKGLLEGIEEMGEQLQFERESHAVRLDTLKRMKEIYLDEQRSKNLLEVELGIDS